MNSTTYCFVNHEKKVAFKNIPRNASTSIRMAMNGQYELFADIPDDYYTFTVLRNPLDRFASAVLRIFEPNYARNSLAQYGISNFSYDKDNLDLLMAIIHQHGFFDDHLLPQSGFVEGFRIDEVFRFENLPTLVAEFNKRGLGAIERHNNTDADLKNQVILDIDMEEIGRLYAKDFELWQRE